MVPEDETIATIYTPDMPSDIVHSMLCLLYTGQANVTWRTLQDINECFRLIGRQLSRDVYFAWDPLLYKEGGGGKYFP